MAHKELDIVVFGATGFTGSRVAANLLRATEGSGRHAVAGRNLARLEQLLRQTGAPPSTKAIQADVHDADSLLAMAKSARLVINCVGPYRYWGEQVVQACLAGGAHYLDVSGEPEFIELMEYKYGAQAAAAGLHMASAAGFDSVPADLGTIYTARQFAPPALPASVESFLTVRTGPAGFRGNYATWESAVMGFGSAGELRRLRQRIQADKKQARPSIPGPRPKAPTGAEYRKELGRYALPFPGADASVVRRTQAAQAARGQPPVHYSAFFTVASRWSVLLFAVFGAVFQLLARRAWGRRLLLAAPGLFSYGLFSRTPPSEEQLQQTGFTMDFIARGYSSGPPAANQRPDREVVTRMSGPEIGYVATPIFVVHAALTVLQEADQLGPPGITTVGTLLADTTYLDRLRKNGITLDKVSERKL